MLVLCNVRNPAVSLQSMHAKTKCRDLKKKIFFLLLAILKMYVFDNRNLTIRILKDKIQYSLAEE